MATKVAVKSLSAESSPRNPKIKKAEAPKKTAVSKMPKTSSSHPTFQQMITDAIVALKERTGSSQYAITKYIEENHKQLPANFKKLVLNSLKKLVAAGKLVKVKNSFKLPSTRSAAPTVEKPKPAKAGISASNPKPKTAAKASAAGAKRKATEKPKSKAEKVARTSGKIKSPGRKVAKPAKKVAVKKPKSVKSPKKKAAGKEA